MRPAVSARLHLGWEVVPSAGMEVVMQHLKAGGISEEVSRIAAAPTCRRSLTYRMYDKRWLRFSNWATGQGIDPLGPTASQIASFLFSFFKTDGFSPQMVKGYRFCLASVLSKAAVVQDRVISDMILYRARETQVYASTTRM